MSTALLLATASLLIIAVSAVAAKSLRHFSRRTLEDLCQRRGDGALLSQVLRWYDPVSRSAETLQVVATAVLAGSGGYWIWQQGDWDDPQRWGWLVVGGLLLLLAEIWLPAAISRLWAEPFIYFTWRLWYTVKRLLLPLEWLYRGVNGFVHRLAGRQPALPTEESFDEEIRTIVTEGHREGLLEEDEREMIEGIIELGEAVVSQIMTPRTDMVCLQVDTPLNDVLDFVIRSGHTRIPVYKRNLDDVVGVLYSKDLLIELARPADQRRALKDIMRRPYFVPETKSVKSLLQDFQRTHSHMAVVLDEYGGVSGLVTIEDVLEEIVGEIVDEYDEEVAEGIWLIDANTCEALARVHVDEINQRLGLHLNEEGDFDTIGGLVFSQFGHVPVAGEQVICDNARIEVLQASPRRIERVRISVLDPEAARTEQNGR